jgi:hypothetical protein
VPQAADHLARRTRWDADRATEQAGYAAAVAVLDGRERATRDELRDVGM